MKILIVFTFAAAAVLPLQARTWTASDGRTLEADYVSATDTEVKLRRASDGRVFTLPLTRLSDEDQAFIKEQADNPPPPAPVEGEYADHITGDWHKATHGKLPYVFYASKRLDPSQKYPLVVSLHGKSDNNENGLQIGFSRTFTKESFYSERPCLVLAPLCYQPHGATGGGWSAAPGEETLDLVKDLIKKLPLIDPDRVYVIGYSMGGFGTWHFLKEEPRLFAAGVPVAGGSSNVGKLRSMPIWAFHGDKDSVVPVALSRQCAEELKRSKVFKYTEIAGGGHGIIMEVLNDEKVHEWLFAQKR